MYGCGLGAVTSASRMAFAFARDGGLPASAFQASEPSISDARPGHLAGGVGCLALH